MDFAKGEQESNPEEYALKCRMLMIYNERLNERARRKQFILERGLLNVKKMQAADRKRTKEEREIHARFAVFARFQSQVRAPRPALLYGSWFLVSPASVPPTANEFHAQELLCVNDSSRETWVQKELLSTFKGRAASERRVALKPCVSLMGEIPTHLIADTVSCTQLPTTCLRATCHMPQRK